MPELHQAKGRQHRGHTHRLLRLSVSGPEPRRWVEAAAGGDLGVDGGGQPGDGAGGQVARRGRGRSQRGLGGRVGGSRAELGVGLVGVKEKSVD